MLLDVVYSTTFPSFAFQSCIRLVVFLLLDAVYFVSLIVSLSGMTEGVFEDSKTH